MVEDVRVLSRLADEAMERWLMLPVPERLLARELIEPIMGIIKCNIMLF